MLFAGSFRVSVCSRVKIKPVAEACSHFLWCCFLVLFKHAEATYAMSFIPISFPTLKRRRPEKNKNIIYRARSVRMGKKTVPLVLSTALGLDPYSSDFTKKQSI